VEFPISRDPPEGGTVRPVYWAAGLKSSVFPISRDPPEGGTGRPVLRFCPGCTGFQFLGIPPKGEQDVHKDLHRGVFALFPISRDPPEGGTYYDSYLVYN